MIEAGARAPASPASLAAVLVAVVIVTPASFAVAVAIDPIAVLVSVAMIALDQTSGHADSE